MKMVALIPLDIVRDGLAELTREAAEVEAEVWDSAIRGVLGLPMRSAGKKPNLLEMLAAVAAAKEAT